MAVAESIALSSHLSFRRQSSYSSTRLGQSFAACRCPFDPRRSRLRVGAAPLRSAAVVALQKSEHDVVVVGAGIIGLAVARQLLLSSDLSVAVVDAAVPCAGATGAGQGYIWMVHRTPGSETWELAVRSKQLWQDFAESIREQGSDPEQVLGWKKTGSLLVGRTLEDSCMLEKRVSLLNEGELKAEYISAASLHSEEPALEIGQGGAAFVPNDCQMDASRTVAFIEKGNKQFSSDGRYAEFYNDPALSLLRSFTSGDVDDDQNFLSVSMTATLDVNGDLLLGQFFPVFKTLSLDDKKTDVGAALTTLGTAEMVAEMILGKPRSVDHTPFNVQGRFC